MPDLKQERRVRQMGFNVIAGVDEAGRGPLAGPVVAGAVILPEFIGKGSGLWRIRDSKKLSSSEREELFEIIMQESVAVGAGEADSQEIDRLNIFQATLLAMERAVMSLSVQPDFCLVDGIRRIDSVPSQAIKKGDLICLSISAASIIAKVIRDRKMKEFEKIYPGYGFAENKGYATVEHRRALLELGPCPIHRLSFEPVRLCADRFVCIPNKEVSEKRVERWK